MILYNSGCSFTTPGPKIQETDMWFHLLAKDIGCDKVINESRPGSSNDLIVQRVYRHALDNANEQTLYTINLTSLNRVEIEPTQSEKMQLILVHDALARYDFETVELNVYAHLVGIVTLLESKKSKYIVVNNSKGFIKGQWKSRDVFMQFVGCRDNICNLYDDARMDFHQHKSKIKPYDFNLYGWNGHDGPEGHHAYYQMLKSKIDL